MSKKKLGEFLQESPLLNQVHSPKSRQGIHSPKDEKSTEEGLVRPNKVLVLLMKLIPESTLFCTLRQICTVWHSSLPLSLWIEILLGIDQSFGYRVMSLYQAWPLTMGVDESAARSRMKGLIPLLTFHDPLTSSEYYIGGPLVARILRESCSHLGSEEYCAFANIECWRQITRSDPLDRNDRGKRIIERGSRLFSGIKTTLYPCLFCRDCLLSILDTSACMVSWDDNQFFGTILFWYTLATGIMFAREGCSSGVVDRCTEMGFRLSNVRLVSERYEQVIRC